MNLKSVYVPGRLALSFEIFPPKTPEGDAALEKTLERLTQHEPAFVSCTYGAGGTTQDRTLDWCELVQQKHQRPATAHFTCVGSSRADLLDWLNQATSRGVENIMALRGDPPQGETEFTPAPDGLRYASELVTLIREHHPEMGIGVAGYPEKHQECVDADTDLKNLKHKVDCGADAVFTQLFFENDNFFKFRDRCDAIGINKPIVAGIMPITEFGRIQRITKMCGAFFPEDLKNRLAAVQDDKAAQFEIGVEHAIKQCEELIKAGVPGIHFYVLNRSDACERILSGLGTNIAAA